jgi:hypothetical protein
MANTDSNPQSFLSEPERKVLAEICKKHGLDVADVEYLLNLERDMQSMGRRHGIHMQIRDHVATIAAGMSKK